MESNNNNTNRYLSIKAVLYNLFYTIDYDL